MIYDIYDELADEFEKRGYQWKKSDGTYFTPTADDIRKTVDKAVVAMYDGPEGAVVIYETGRLIVQKNGTDLYDIYMHMGETK